MPAEPAWKLCREAAGSWGVLRQASWCASSTGLIGDVAWLLKVPAALLCGVKGWLGSGHARLASALPGPQMEWPGVEEEHGSAQAFQPPKLLLPAGLPPLLWPQALSKLLRLACSMAPRSPGVLAEASESCSCRLAAPRDEEGQLGWGELRTLLARLLGWLLAWAKVPCSSCSICESAWHGVCGDAALLTGARHAASAALWPVLAWCVGLSGHWSACTAVSALCWRLPCTLGSVQSGS
jgi:hypothetical protein